MRIIGGKYSKRIIKPPKNLPVRPTTDLAKESLFNILNNKIEFQDKTVLDLFTGTGSLAYEFCSRGCKQVIAVDQNYQCVQFVKKTAFDLGMEQLKVVRSEAFRFIKNSQLKFDIIFADPPYNLENIHEISLTVFEKQMLNHSGWFIVEHPKEVDFTKQEHFVEHRKYGHVNFSFFNL